MMALIFGGISQIFVLNIINEVLFAGILGLVAIFLGFATTKRLNRERLVLAQD